MLNSGSWFGINKNMDIKKEIAENEQSPNDNHEKDSKPKR